jgi:3-methyladenine DNA glycosylase AlkD
VAIDPDRSAAELVAALRAAGDPARAAQERRYLRSELRHLGVSVPAIRGVTRRFTREHRDLTRAQLTGLVESLWREPVHERRVAAVELLSARGDLLLAEDVPLLERLIRESRTWALVDGLAVTVAGGLLRRFPELGATLDRWARDGDLWVRRAALLALLQPLRRGGGDFARFSGYADRMLAERELFIRKAIGWVLRETSKERPDLVFEWLEPRAGRASGVTVREAVKYLPEGQRERILSAHRAGRGPAGAREAESSSREG